MAFDLFQDRIVQGSVGDPFVSLNDVLIKPVTEMQSGTAGRLQFPSNFLDLSIETHSMGFGSLISGVGLSMGNIRIDNLASVVAPVELLSPTTQASTLWNDVTMSPGSPEAIELRVAFRLAIDGEDSPLAMNDEIDFKISLNTMALSGEVQASVESSKFLRMPLGHIFNIDCWLATMASPGGLDVSSIATSLVGLKLEADCVACSDAQFYLQSMFIIFGTAGAVELLGSRLSSLAESILEGDGPIQQLVDRMLSEAQYACPVSSQYDPDFVQPDYPPLGFPNLTPTDLDTLLFTAMLGEFGSNRERTSSSLFCLTSSFC